jgi:hypothetical protein
VSDPPGSESIGMQAKGPPGTWEVLCSPREETLRAASTKWPRLAVRALITVGANRAQCGVRRNEGNEVKPEGVRDVGVC